MHDSPCECRPSVCRRRHTFSALPSVRAARRGGAR
ncbi:hypothetical protein DSM3645_03858 [Blastopirellula marina DSM 3645]|uniref:Uncharacterized protein n=1 Tax=Blastopirellula marina DSM 3645 TaxID=314230 RepID=A3ZV83_9BACT|nr:hypothetical protein DSM3645_03858 [Blastopirellula marina DSM 3645]